MFGIYHNGDLIKAGTEEQCQLFIVRNNELVENYERKSNVKIYFGELEIKELINFFL